MKAPGTTADLNILHVRQEGADIVITPRIGAGGFRQADFLTELKFLQCWLANRSGVAHVLIDIAQNEYLRGRTLAGLLLLKDHLPEGAEFAVCGESQLLRAVLDKMQARDDIPVFMNTQSAFLVAPRRPLRDFINRMAAAAIVRRSALTRVAVGLLVVATLVALVPLVASVPERDYHKLLSMWEQLQTLRAASPGSTELTEFQNSSRKTAAKIASRYRTISKRTPQEDRLLSAADALYQSLAATGADQESEFEFVQTMQAIADELQVQVRPQRSDHHGPRRRSLVD